LILLTHHTRTQHANVPVEFEKFNVSGDTTEDAALFKRSMDSLRRNKVGLKGALPACDTEPSIGPLAQY